MPTLFSGSRRGSGGIFSPQTLPTTNSSRQKSRFRRRHNIRPTSIFLFVSLSILIIFFLFVLLRQGVPIPSPNNPQKARLTRRPNIRRQYPAVEIRRESTAVDITTRELYEKIDFLDRDGGAWKQGWDVRYEGKEWDEEKLKVFVVPHSHNDPGWILTVDEYYDRQSRHILDTIVDSLSKDERRKFIWEEMSYLERWWRDSSTSQKERFTKLVKNGQLEIVGGGWVMNDEANSHYFAIIEQMMEGNTWLNETLGVVPKNSWSIDPFGYSATMAYLLRRMGFQNMLIQRTHYELKKELALHKNLEFVWRQTWDIDETTDIFVHMMPFYSYDIPHTCGPEPAICCQFDFARMRGHSYEACPWRIDPVETSPNNVQERSLMLLDQYKKKSTLYRTNTLLVPLGDDFRYVSSEEAEVQFRNYQMLFDYINDNPSLNAEVKFGTLEDYFSTLREEAYRINFTRRHEVGSGEIEGFPSLSGDFFTYADRNQDYWSGYYVSRPFFKAVDRVLEQTLRASEIMAALVLGYCHKFQCSKLPISYAYKLTAARRNLALFQHHDGVTGTAKNHVVEDYGNRMHMSLQDLHFFMSRAVEILLSDFHDKSDPALLSFYEPEQSRSRYDVQPVHRNLGIHQNRANAVVLFNPIEQTREEIVMVIVTKADATVLNSNESCISSQISPEWQHDSEGKIVFTGRHRLYFRASVPPLGLETYYVTHGNETCEKPSHAELKVFSESFSCPPPYACSKIEEDTAEIHNLHHTLIFDVKQGLLNKIKHNKEGKETAIEEEIDMYTSSGSGAYLFKPKGDAHPVVENGGSFIISEGPLVLEAYSLPKISSKRLPISHSTRIYTGDDTIQQFLIEKEYHVELTDNEFNDRELIVRYKTDINNKRVFYSDLNGFQMSRRETYDKIPLQGNYYPMPSLAFLQNSYGNRFSVHSRQSLGAASLKNGWLEIMLDRRLVRDDGRGLGQGVLDNRPMNVIFHLLIESNVSSSPSNNEPSLLSHSVGAHLNYPMHKFVSKKEIDMPLKLDNVRTFSPLASPLPCDLHIVNLKVPQPLKASTVNLDDPRFAIILQRRGWDPSYCNKGGLQCTRIGDESVNLSYLFKDLSVSNLKGTSLNLLHDDVEMLGYIDHMGDGNQEGNLIIAPMELQAYKFELQPQVHEE